MDAGALGGDIDVFLRDDRDGGGERHEATKTDDAGGNGGEFQQTQPRRQWSEEEWRELSS